MCPSSKTTRTSCPTGSCAARSVAVSEPSSTIDEARLARALAVETARLVRVTTTLVLDDPWELLPAVTGRCSFNATSDDEQCTLGLGVARAWSFRGPRRFARAEARYRKLREELVTLPLREEDRDLCEPPLVFVGFAFSSRPARDDSPWRNWPAGRLVLPRALLSRRHDGAPGECQVSVALCASPGDDPRTLIRKLVRTLSRLEELARRTTKRRGDSPRAALATVSRETEQKWRARLARAHREITRGSLDKVVLAREVELRSHDHRAIDVAVTLANLRRQNPRSAVFAMSHRGEGVFLGASPERLLSLRGEDLETHALAGTTGEDCRGLKESAKDRDEHAVVVRQLRRRLAPFCRTLRIDPSPRILALPHVRHLETRIEGRLARPRTALALAAALHPTAAVCGSPAAAARRWLARHEPFARGWYAGLTGTIDLTGDASFSVAIRSALVYGDRAYAYAGAGVVAASDPTAEWAEIELKLITISEGLAFAKASA